jgi:hypothetical protein
MNTDLILVSESSLVCQGLVSMVDALCGLYDGLSCEDTWFRSYMEAGPILIVIELAKRAEDKPEWFLHGKWATIQSLQGRVDAELTRLCSSPVAAKP